MSQKIKGQYRQGDVLIMNPTVDFKLTKKLIVNHQPDKQRTVLEFGEVTGHAHAIADKAAVLYEWNGDRLLEIKSKTAVKHEEHSAIQLAPGKKEIRRQTQYTPAELRNMAD